MASLMRFKWYCFRFLHPLLLLVVNLYGIAFVSQKLVNVGTLMWFNLTASTPMTETIYVSSFVKYLFICFWHFYIRLLSQNASWPLDHSVVLCKYLLPTCGWEYVVFSHTKMFYFNAIEFASLVRFLFLSSYLRTSSIPWCRKYIILHFNLMSFPVRFRSGFFSFYFWYSSVVWGMEKLFYFFPVDGKLYPFHIDLQCPFYHPKFWYKHGFLSRVPLFISSVHLPVPVWITPLLIPMALQWVLTSERIPTPTFFFFKSVLMFLLTSFFTVW